MQTNLGKRTGIINENTVIATIDFGKRINSGYCRCPNGSELPSFEFFNDGRGFEKFWSQVSMMACKQGSADIVVGFESTGPYAEPLTHYLRKRNVRLVQVNSTHTKRVKELFDNSPNKTDAKDPKVIADLIELGRVLTVVVPEGASAELRRLTHARERHKAHVKTLKNQMHDVVFLLFPEFLREMSLDAKSAKALLSECPTPEGLLELGVEVVTKLLRCASRGKLGRARAEALIAAARGSVGLREGQSGLALELRQQLALLTSYDGLVAEIEQKLAEYLQDVSYSEYLLSLKGVGVVTVAGLIGEVGDFNNFRTASELLKYAGLNLYEMSSGQSRGRRRISKRGRPLMRKLLHFAALNAIRRGGILHAEYQAYLDRGMLKLKALVAISRKLLGIMLALVREQSHYLSDYSNMHQFKQAA